jgi:hypothetical protein
MFNNHFFLVLSFIIRIYKTFFYLFIFCFYCNTFSFCQQTLHFDFFSNLVLIQFKLEIIFLLLHFQSSEKFSLKFLSTKKNIKRRMKMRVKAKKISILLHSF